MEKYLYLASNLYPELLVSIAFFLTIVLISTKLKKLTPYISVFLLFLASFHIVKNQVYTLNKPAMFLKGMFILDNLTFIFKFLLLIVIALIILGSIKYSNNFAHKDEFLVLILGSTIGIMCLISSYDLISLFVALETVSLSSILLAGYSKYDSRSSEASLKYLLNSASASAIFLFGLAILYGITGQTQFNQIKNNLLIQANNETISLAIITLSLILILIGLAFKLAAAPMHMWSPDVYEGSPTPVTAFLAVASKIAGFVITLRLIFLIFDFSQAIWQPIICVIAILSMIIGNFVALGEVIKRASIKRLMAYSSIAQIGYVLIGIAVSTNTSVSASIFYMIAYSIVNLGAFLCIIAFGNESNSDSISDYAGLMNKRPLLALAFAVCLFNLAGLPIPPLGFIAKFILLKSAFESGFIGIVLGMIALITTILSIYYYSYIAKLMIVDSESSTVSNLDSSSGLRPQATTLGNSRSLNAAILAIIVVVFIGTFVSHSVLNLADNATAYTIGDSKHINPVPVISRDLRPQAPTTKLHIFN